MDNHHREGDPPPKATQAGRLGREAFTAQPAAGGVAVYRHAGAWLRRGPRCQTWWSMTLALLSRQ